MGLNPPSPHCVRLICRTWISASGTHWLAENVRDYAIFLMDSNGIIRCWGESARLMKWWTKQQAEGSHLRMLYEDGGLEDG